MKIFATITKVDEDKRMVYGYASTEALDSQGERVSKDAIESALPEYMRFANIREMHQPSAVGVAKDASVDDKGLYLSVKVVDESAWQKVKEGVYKGFSIGGRMVEKVGDIITNLKLSEISLVDRPANPEAVFEMWKSAEKKPSDKADDSDIDKFVALLDQHGIDIVKAHEIVAKSMTAIEKQEDKPAEKPAEPAPAEPAAAPEIKKGMYTVAMLAGILDQLNVLKEMTEYEAESEGDMSPVPEQLKSNVEALAATLRAMVSEETAELTAPMAMSEKIGDLEKSETDKAGDIDKAGARNSSADQTRVQKMHDMATELGAACSSGKSVETEDLKKSDDIKKLSESLAKLEGENAELKKRVETLEAEPVPARGALKAIDKAEDVARIEPVVKPVLKEDGTINETATAIRKAHATGGVRIRP